MNEERFPLPESFQHRLKLQFPDLASEVLEGLNQPGLSSILQNTLKKSTDLPSGEPVSWYVNGRTLDERIIFAADPLWHAGTYYVQEASSMMLGYVLNSLKELPAKPKVIDLCAAPGGKSHIIQNFLKDEGVLWANEIHPGRAKILQQNIVRFGHASVIVSNSDPATLATLNLKFDIVVVDAPCSGEGMFRKDDVARQEWNIGLPQMCAGRQREILDSATDLVAEGGYLIYSTCTFAEEENINQIQKLIEEGDWTCITPTAPDGINCTEISNGKARGLQMFPGLNRSGEGFFIAVLRKETSNVKSRSKKQHSPQFSLFNNSRVNIPESWHLNGIETRIWQDKNGTLFHWPVEVEQMIYSLNGNIRILQSGVPFAQPKGSSLIPEHAFALSVYKSSEISCSDVTLDEAKVYLRGNAPDKSNFKDEGWSLITYKSYALGWVKVLSGRVNNYYPKELRLLHY